ncbi:MAG: porin PorA family protein [Blastococcus sp.]
MRPTRAAVIVAVVGVVLLVAAAIVRFVVLPSVNKLGSDFSSSQNFSGTYTGLNPAVLAGNTSAGVLVRDVPATATRKYAVDSTDGDTALVTRTITRTVGGLPQPTPTARYAVDRVNFGSVPAPSGATGVVKSTGLIFTLPQHPSTSTTYQLWDETTAAAYPLKYVTTSTVAGRTTYDYTTTATGKIVDPASLGLPVALPKVQLTALAPSLAGLLPPAVLAQLSSVLARLPGTIPISYTSTTTATISADSTLGSPLKTASTQEITAQLGPIAALRVPFSTLKLTTTAASSKATADDTAGTVSQLNLVGTVLPIVLAVVGIILIVVALLLARRAAGRQTGGPAPTSRQGASTATPA